MTVQTARASTEQEEASAGAAPSCHTLGSLKDFGPGGGKGPAEEGIKGSMLDGLTPLEIGPQDGSCGSSIKGEQHGDEEECSDDDHEEHDSHVGHVKSPSIKPSRENDGLFKKALSPGSKSKMTKVHSANDMAKLCLSEAVSEESKLTAPLSPHRTLEHTTGTVKEDGGAHVGAARGAKAMKKALSSLDMHKMVDSEEEAPEESSDIKATGPPGEHLLVVLDMDHTMVGNLVALSDRDNIESNIEWDYWPEGVERGLSAEAIVPYLQRGMLRPGLIKTLEYLKEIGATVVVYTHSEFRWAVKVCEAMEIVVGFKFIFRLFSRTDCRDGHPEFLAKKSLEFVVDKLRLEDGLEWATVDNCVMFDDDKNAVYAGEISRLVIVPSYDYWEGCAWDEIITEELLSKNSEDVVDLVKRTVVEWGVAPPSYGKDEASLSVEERDMDERWQAQRDKKRAILLSYNKVSRLDRLWASVRTALTHVSYFDDEHLDSFPEKVKKIIGSGRGLF